MDDAILAEIEHAKGIRKMGAKGQAGGLQGAEQLRCDVEHKALIDDSARAPEMLDDIGKEPCVAGEMKNKKEVT